MPLHLSLAFNYCKCFYTLLNPQNSARQEVRVSIYLTEEETGASESAKSGGWTQKGTGSIRLHGLSFWTPHLERQRVPWRKRNRGHHTPVPHLKNLWPPLSRRGSDKVGGGGVLPEQGPGTLLPQVRPKQYLGHDFCRSCRPPPTFQGSARLSARCIPRFGPSGSRFCLRSPAG